MRLSKKFSNWFFNLSYAFMWVGKAFIGKAVPHFVVDTADNHYHRPTKAQVGKAIPILAREMEIMGFTRENWILDKHDCDNSSLFAWDECANVIFPALYAQDNTNANYQTDCGMFSFVRQDNGLRHRVAFVVDEDGDWWFIDSYDHIEGNDGILRTLSPRERAAGYVIR